MSCMYYCLTHTLLSGTLSLESGHMQSSGDDGLIIMSFQPSLQEMLIAMGEKIRKCFLLSQSD